MLTDPETLPAGSLFSFNAPCLKWKLLCAFKTHFGLPGFQGQNRYLTKTITETKTTHFAEIPIVGGHPVYDDTITTWQTTLVVDRLTGLQTSAGTIPDPVQFIGLPSRPPSTSEIVGDDHAIFTSLADNGILGYTRWVWDVQFSNPYSLTDLEADCDALISGVNLDAVPARSFLPLVYLGDNPIAGIHALQRFFPASFPNNFPGNFNFNQPTPLPRLAAAAVCAYNPDLFLDFDQFGMVKMVGFVAMAGDCCQKTFVLDNHQQPVGSSTCVSSRGCCANYFQVTPPPLVPGRNAYVLVVPNCQCSDL